METNFTVFSNRVGIRTDIIDDNKIYLPVNVSFDEFDINHLPHIETIEIITPYNLARFSFDILNKLFEKLSLFTELKTLIMIGFKQENFNELTELPESFCKLTKMTTLILKNNHLIKLPESFGNLKNLENIVLENNKLTELPESFGNLTNLKSTNLNNNLLTKLPESFGNLKNLKLFVSNKNLLTKLPESFGNLTNLEEIVLEKNKLTELPESFGNLIHLKYINLRDNKLTELPESFGNLTNLKNFMCGTNLLTKLPESFGNLIHLKEINLKNNKLTELPESFGNLTNLQEIVLEKNKLTKIPESFGNLINLEVFVSGTNLLTKLPESFGNLTKLNIIYLENNRLNTLPESFGNLINLQELVLFANELTELPEYFCNFTNIITLDVDENTTLHCTTPPINPILLNLTNRIAIDPNQIHKEFKKFKFAKLEQKLKENHPNLDSELNAKYPLFDEKLKKSISLNTEEPKDVPTLSMALETVPELYANLKEKHPLFFVNNTLRINKERFNALTKSTFKILMKNTFTDIINTDLTESEKNKAQTDLEFIYVNRLNLVDFDLPHDIVICCCHILVFLLLQPKEFRSLYVISYLYDVINAYEYPEPLSRLSCANGMIERIITTFYNTCGTMSNYETNFTNKTEEETNALKKEYTQYNDTYEKPIPDLVVDWIKTFNKKNKKLNKTIRKNSLSVYLKLNKPNNVTNEKIDEYVDAMEFDDDDLTYGGKRKTRKGKKKRKNTKTIKKSIKRRGKKTIKRRARKARKPN